MLRDLPVCMPKNYWITYKIPALLDWVFLCKLYIVQAYRGT